MTRSANSEQVASKQRSTKEAFIWHNTFCWMAFDYSLITRSANPESSMPDHRTLGVVGFTFSLLSNGRIACRFSSEILLLALLFYPLIWMGMKIVSQPLGECYFTSVLLVSARLRLSMSLNLEDYEFVSPSRGRFKAATFKDLFFNSQVLNACGSRILGD